MAEEVKIFLDTGNKNKSIVIEKLNEYLKQGYTIDTITCDNCDSYEVEAYLLIYLVKSN